MLSIKEGKHSVPVAFIPESDKFIYYDPEENRKEEEDDLEQLIAITSDVLYDSDKRKQLSSRDIASLEDALENRRPPKDIRLAKIYDMAIRVLNERQNKEYFTEELVYPCPFVNPDEEQTSRVYVTGPSGSGKSTWIARYCEMWLYFFPKHDIFLFSRKSEDPTLDKIQELKRIVIDESFLEKPMEVEEIRDPKGRAVMVIFDDVDALQDKKLLKSVKSIQTQLLEIGRSSGIWMCNVSHQIMAYKATRDLINNSDFVVFFPSNSKYHINRFLKEYQGFNKQQIDRIFKLKSRWVCLKRNDPGYVVYEHGAYLM